MLLPRMQAMIYRTTEPHEGISSNLLFQNNLPIIFITRSNNILVEKGKVNIFLQCTSLMIKEFMVAYLAKYFV